MLKKYKKMALVTVASVLLIVTLIQYAISYGAFSYNLRAIFKYYAGVSVERAIVDTELLLNDYLNMAIRISMNSDIRKLWIGDGLSGDEKSDIIKSFKLFKAETQYTDLIYIYNDTTKILYSDTLLSGDNYISDKNIKTILEERNQKNNFDLIIDVDEANFSNVSYVVYYPFNGSANAVIVKIDFSKFSDAFSNIAFYNDGYLWISDETGKIYYGDSNFFEDKDITGIINEKNSYKVMKKDGNNWMFYCGYEEMLGHYFIFGISESFIADHLNLQQEILYVFILLIMLIIIAIVMYASQFFVKKVEMVKLRSVTEKGNSEKDINDFITMENLLSVSVFSANVFDITTVYNAMEFGIDFSKPVSLMLLQIKDYEEFCLRYNTEYERNNFKYYIISAVCKRMMKTVPIQGIRLENDRMLLFVNGGEAEMKTYAENILRDIENYTNFRFNIFFTKPVNYKQFGKQYRLLDELVKYRYIYNEASVLSTEIFEKMLLVDYNKFEGYINCISNLIIFGETKKAMEQNDILFDMLKKIDINQTKAVVFELAEKIQYAVSLSEQKYSVTISKKRLLTVQGIVEAKYLNDIYLLIQQIFAELEIELERKRNTFTNIKSTVVRVKNYIDENYTNSNLGIEAIASEFNLSPTYIGRIFQREYGDSITNVILNNRLEMAAELLTTTSDTASNISTKVGFNSSSYMGVQFKKKYGMSPGEYRKYKMK